MLEINTSKIVNTVTFTVDKSSIAEAKKPPMTFNAILKSWRIRRFVSRLKSNEELKRGNK
jgi:hypothetical protein